MQVVVWRHVDGGVNTVVRGPRLAVRQSQVDVVVGIAGPPSVQSVAKSASPSNSPSKIFAPLYCTGPLRARYSRSGLASGIMTTAEIPQDQNRKPSMPIKGLPSLLRRKKGHDADNDRDPAKPGSGGHPVNPPSGPGAKAF